VAYSKITSITKDTAVAVLLLVLSTTEITSYTKMTVQTADLKTLITMKVEGISL